MTREEAIFVLHKIKSAMRRADGKSLTHLVETMALDLAIEALGQETVSRESYDHEFFLRKEFEVKIAKLEKTIESLRQEPCEDAISRSGTIKYLNDNMVWYDGYGELADSDEKLKAITDL